MCLKNFMEKLKILMINKNTNYIYIKTIPSYCQKCRKNT